MAQAPYKNNVHDSRHAHNVRAASARLTKRSGVVLVESSPGDIVTGEAFSPMSLRLTMSLTRRVAKAQVLVRGRRPPGA